MRAIRFFAVFFLLFGVCITSCSATRGSHAKKKPILQGVQTTHCNEDVTLTADFVKPTIILDAGHGGSDHGCDVNHLLEKKITLSTVYLTKKALETLGYKVVLTRAKDVFVSLPRRVAIANKINPVIFVSVHYNSSRNSLAKGIEVFYYDSQELWKSKASKRLAHLVLHHLLDYTEAPSRGVKKGNFHVIRETNMPSILIEAGFMTNLEERKMLRDKVYLEKIAGGIAKGIDKYLKS